jgi:putative hydrolase of the HAD superfamily
MGTYDAVFFDAANTLLYPYPAVGAQYTEVAARYQVTTTADAVQQAFRHAWGQVQAQSEQDPTRYGIGEPDGRRFWHALVHATFTQIALPESFDLFFDELYTRFAAATAYRLYPETLSVLKQLRQEGYRVAVISNWDSRLTAILEGLGLMEYLHHVTISAVVGWEKPHPAVFDHALQAVSVSPSRALHVGDSLREDIQGAAQAGLQPLWIQRQEMAASPYPVIQDLNGVLEWLRTSSCRP